MRMSSLRFSASLVQRPVMRAASAAAAATGMERATLPPYAPPRRRTTADAHAAIPSAFLHGPLYSPPECTLCCGLDQLHVLRGASLLCRHAHKMSRVGTSDSGAQGLMGIVCVHLPLGCMLDHKCNKGERQGQRTNFNAVCRHGQDARDGRLHAVHGLRRGPHAHRAILARLCDSVLRLHVEVGLGGQRVPAGDLPHGLRLWQTLMQYHQGFVPLPSNGAWQP